MRMSEYAMYKDTSHSVNHCRVGPIYRLADKFGRYRYRYIGIGKLDIVIGLSVSVFGWIDIGYIGIGQIFA